MYQDDFHRTHDVHGSRQRRARVEQHSDRPTKFRSQRSDWGKYQRKISTRCDR